MWVSGRCARVWVGGWYEPRSSILWARTAPLTRSTCPRCTAAPPPSRPGSTCRRRTPCPRAARRCRRRRSRSRSRTRPWRWPGPRWRRSCRRGRRRSRPPPRAPRRCRASRSGTRARWRAWCPRGSSARAGTATGSRRRCPRRRRIPPDRCRSSPGQRPAGPFPRGTPSARRCRSDSSSPRDTRPRRAPPSSRPPRSRSRRRTCR